MRDAERARVIVVFDSGNAAYITRYLARKFFDKRIILYYWNPVFRSINPCKIDSNNVEIWSFDKSDCEKYNLKYNKQFYFYENAKHVHENNKIIYDAIFVGVDKNRSEVLKHLNNIANHQKLNIKIHLVKSNLKKDQSKCERYEKEVTYSEVLNMYSKSKSIIDVVDVNQVGMTLRPLEALFLKKKLITTMKDIKKYSLYNKDNIFILGEDRDEMLCSFLNSKYNDENYLALIEEYSEKGWLSNFLKG